jgi:hypothetical protein
MRRILTSATMALAMASMPLSAGAQTNESHPHLHINTRWKECSFQLNSALTPAAWRQFSEEAGLVAYFRPLNDAKPMGKGKFEVSLLQWKTGIDDHDAAWNDTFVHPDAEHWLFEGSGLQFPGLMVRAGVSSKTDVALYATKSVGANYGFVGVQVQRNLIGGESRKWAASTRLSITSMYGPDDVDLAVAGLDLLASREFTLSKWASVSPYVGVSSYGTRAHEKSSVVALDDAYAGGSQAMVGATLSLAAARIGVEYNVARVNSFSLKVGFGM